ncbi:molybdenum cofactor biosynthesis protein B [Chromohalobacter canadensis]|uniref:Molybdenum cofactor biosynthesis protein B n=1 Tax=Chromohalobacter canadensis TaxID=141389 RepID=A0A285VGW9_9GAMM|nr:molybdenum cofactor biosynthesis protein B [Chromohalobacter canadensis]SOC53147.1 molybdenum cofactor biosynthesis protein B [Chromohalobacter canadensis]
MAHVHVDAPFVPLNLAVLTVSDTRDFDYDGSGDLLSTRLVEAGHWRGDRRIVADDIYRIRAVVSEWIARDGIHAVLVNGGTGFTPRDTTPEALVPLFDKTIEGFGELFRQISHADIGTSTVQSRAIGGVANRTLMFALPGSPRACATAWDGILASQLDARTRPCNFVAMVRPDAAPCASRQPTTTPVTAEHGEEKQP